MPTLCPKGFQLIANFAMLGELMVTFHRKVVVSRVVSYGRFLGLAMAFWLILVNSLYYLQYKTLIIARLAALRRR